MHGMYFTIYSYINLKNIAGLQYDFHLLKLASTTVEIIYMSLFPFCCAFLEILCHEILVHSVECLSNQSFFLFLARFSPIMAYTRNILTKKTLFIY